MGITYNTGIVKSGLVLHLDAANVKSYPGSGTSWIDLTKNGYNAVLNSTYNVYNSGNAGYFSFTGDGSSGQAATIGNNVAALLSNSNTVEFVMYRTNTQGQILTNVYYAYGESDRIFAKNGTTSLLLNASTNTWEHFVATYNSATSTMTVYKNGQFGGSASSFDMSGLSGGVYLGARPWSPIAQNFRLSQLKIYNRILSVTEIQQNFEAMRGRYNI